MHTYTATIDWKDNEGLFQTGKYSRAHTWSFDGGITVEASSSPLVVKVPFSKEAAVDPEEAFVASLSSCHMLTFLYLAQKAKFVVTTYRDNAVGSMGQTANKKPWIAVVELNPEISFSGTPPNLTELQALHNQAHEECYVANSVKTEIKINL